MTEHRPDPYVVEVLVYDSSIPGLRTLRLSTHSFKTKPTDNPANTFYDGRITDIGGTRRSTFDNGSTSGRASVDFGFVELANDDGVLDNWSDYGWHRALLLKTLSSAAAPVSGAMLELKATVEGIASPDALHSLRLLLRGRMAELDVPLLTTRYLGTTVSVDSTALAEGDADLKDTIKPYAFGSNLNVPGILVNKPKLIYQFANNPHNSITPYDGGINNGLTFDGDVGSLTSLVQGEVAAGHYVTCLNNCAVRFGFAPAFEVTADLVEGAAASNRSAARVIQRMLPLVPTIVSSDIDTAAFDAFHAFNGAEVGIYINTDANAIDLVSQVADSVGGAVIDTVAGMFSAVWNAGPGATADVTLDLRDLLDANGSIDLAAGINNESQGKPAWSVTVNWGRIWKTQSTGQLAPRIAEATTGDDLARKQLVANEFRSATQTDSSVLTKHPLAIALTFNTLLKNQADALAFAANRLALYKVRRDRINFPVSISGGDRGNVELGRTVRVQLDKRGRYHTGVNMLVLGRSDDRTKRERVLTLWG